MGEKLVSVIIPMYNSSEFIQRCLSSVSNQKYTNLEVLIIDDGSTDNSFEIANNFRQVDKRISIVKQSNNGPSIARNTGLKKSAGEYIFFVDSDDVIEENMIGEMVRAAEINGADVVICNMLVKNIQTVREKRLKISQGLIEKESLDKVKSRLFDSHDLSSVSNKLYLKKVILSNNIEFDNFYNYGEDLKFNIQYFKSVSKAFYIDKPFYYYYRGHDSLTNSYKEKMFERTGISLYNIRESFINDYGFSTELMYEPFIETIFYSVCNELNNKSVKKNIGKLNAKKILHHEISKKVITSKNKVDSKVKILKFLLKFQLLNTIIVYLTVRDMFKVFRKGVN